MPQTERLRRMEEACAATDAEERGGMKIELNEFPVLALELVGSFGKLASQRDLI